MIRLPRISAARRDLSHRGLLQVKRFVSGETLERLSDEARGLVARQGVSIDRRNQGSGLVYRVVTGDRIRSDAPSLFSIYAASALLPWIRAVTNRAGISPSSHLRSSINVNCLSTAGQCYPCHRDAVPYTALLFLSSLSSTDGGQFMVTTVQGHLLTIVPTGGDLLLFDGAACPHAVAPLRRNILRLTVPMVYPVHEAGRPDGLDDYLYGAPAASDTSS